jgi:DNA-binding response OmpR family regulator
LLIDDDARLAALLDENLRPQGVALVHAGGGQAGLAALAGGGFDAILLDVMMPGLDGLAVLRTLRDAGHRVPVIMLTARGDEADRVVGLELGADDYVAKPFSPRELAARIKAILRRVEQRSEDAVLAARDIVLRRDSRDVTVAGDAVELTSKEFDLLACFLEHPGIVLSREKLLDLVWGMTYPGGTRTVDVHVAQLRRKLGDAESIRTVRGAGYKLVTA